MVPLPARLAAVPFDEVIAARVNPVTLSLNVAVTGIGDELVVDADVVVRATVGTAESLRRVRFCCADF